ncbi:MAG: radical SAM protein [Deltaproteobacteria bacterium]|nr:MAG: radical SAM protein [Deltaproteobacteria bacterium]
MIYNVAIDITNHCNFDCVHCLRDKLSPRAHMPADILEFILREISSVGLQNVCLTGGEPALHPELQRILETMANYEIQFSLVSNGFLFEENILPLFSGTVRKYLTGICFSLDGSTAASHDMVRKKGSFKKVLRSIDVCVKENIPVSVKSIIHRENRDEIADIAHLCASKGVGNLGYVLLTPTPLLISRNLMLTPAEHGEVIAYITGRIMPSFSMIVNIEGYADPDYYVPFCNPAHGLSFDHEGNFIFCCNLSHPTAGDRPNVLGKEFMGNIRTIGIEEGIVRHYKMLAWFMDKVMHLYREKEQPVNCTTCFRLFGKLNWMNTDESSHHRHC